MIHDPFFILHPSSSVVSNLKSQFLVFFRLTVLNLTAFVSWPLGPCNHTISKVFRLPLQLRLP